MSDYETATFFERLRKGAEDSIAYSKGELTLATTVLPAPPPTAKPRQILSLRKHFRMSQAVFAATLNVSTRTVQSWEQGVRPPSDAALRMLQVLTVAPSVVGMIMTAERQTHRDKPGRRKPAGQHR